MQKPSKKTLHWVRDFISRQQQQEVTKWQLGYKSYLLHSFNDIQVKAIRTGLLKLREEASIAYTKESGFDSGYSLNDPMLQPYLHKLLLTPTNRQEMQKAVAKYYGWEKWVDDPWGNSANFNDWVNDTKDNALAVWAVNETPGGRFYLAYSNQWGLAQFDYSQMSPEELACYIGVGVGNFLWVKHYSGWEKFRYDKEPLPPAFVNKEILKVSPEYPFDRYRFTIFTIYLWLYAAREIDSRIAEHPELEPLLDIVTARTPHLQKITEAIAPRGYHLDENKSLRKFEEATRESLRRVTAKYKARLGGDADSIGYLALQEKGIGYWEKRHTQQLDKDNIIFAGLKGDLLPSLLLIVKHKLIDAIRTEKRYKEHEITESQIDAHRKSQGHEVDTPFLDTVPSPEPTPEEPIDLKSLILNLDKLPPAQHAAVMQYYQAIKDGADLSSKDGASLKQALGKDYENVKRNFARAVRTLKSLNQ